MNMIVPVVTRIRAYEIKANRRVELYKEENKLLADLLLKIGYRQLPHENG